MWSTSKLIDFAIGYAAPHKVLLLTKSGSHLHGTNTPESDHDYKGVFLPDVNYCLLQKKIESIEYSSGNNDSRNDNSDVDIQMWSVQHWCNLLSAGDSNALSVLFATFNHEMVVYADPLMVNFMDRWSELYHINKVDSFVGFADAQVFRYALKGERLSLLEKINNWFQLEYVELGLVSKLEHYDLNALIDQCDPEQKYMSIVHDDDGRTFLSVLTKKHMTSIKLGEFIDKIKKEIEKYGARTKKTTELNNTDWKAISHSLRCYYEAIEILSKGYVQYPLEYADFLLQVKRGEIPIDDIKKAFPVLKETIEKLKQQSGSNYNEQTVFSKILELYSAFKFNEG